MSSGSAHPAVAMSRTITVEINKEKVETRPYQDPSGTVHVYLERRGEQWRATLPQKLMDDASEA